MHPPPPMCVPPLANLQELWKVEYCMSMMNGIPCYLPHPHLLVWVTSVRFLSARATFKIGSGNESICLQPMLVLSVHWWPVPVSVGAVLRSTTHATPPPPSDVGPSTCWPPRTLEGWVHDACYVHDAWYSLFDSLVPASQRPPKMPAQQKKTHVSSTIWAKGQLYFKAENGKYINSISRTLLAPSPSTWCWNPCVTIACHKYILNSVISTPWNVRGDFWA